MKSTSSSMQLLFVAVFLVVTSCGQSQWLQWAKARTSLAEKMFRKTHSKYTPSPDFWPDHVIYSMQVDRFNNGNLSNDFLNISPEQRDAMEHQKFDGIWSWRHGGDIQGITDRLDYLVDLGVGTLWVTPVFHNTGDYHGYCLTDPTVIDPGFGTFEEFATMVDEAHKRHMFVVLDIVVNHMCDPSSKYAKWPDHGSCPNDLAAGYWAGQNNTHSASQGKLTFSSSFFLPFQNQDFFNRCGADTTAEMQSESNAAIYGDFTSEMFDYDTRDKDFHALFTELHKYWIAAADIDGYRMDAAKHITEDFIAYFSTNVRAFAQGLGKTNFFVVGEVAASADWIASRLGQMMINPRNPSQHGNVPQTLVEEVEDLMPVYLNSSVAPYPGLTASYAFEESGTSRDVLQNKKPTSAIEDYFNSADYRTVNAQNDFRFSWTMLEIHDWPRFAYDHPTDSYMEQIAVSYLLTGPATPILYYGLEQGFNGHCAADSVHCGNYSDVVWGVCNAGGDDSLKRQDMFVGGPWKLASTLGSITNLSYVGHVLRVPSPPWKEDPFLDRTNMLFTRTRALARLRQSCTPLRRGFFQTNWVEGSAGLLAFSRIASPHEIVVIMNTGAWSKSLNGKKFMMHKEAVSASGVVYSNAMNPLQIANTGFEDGNAFLYPMPDLSICGRCIMIFVQRDLLLPWNNDLGVALCR